MEESCQNGFSDGESSERMPSFHTPQKGPQRARFLKIKKLQVLRHSLCNFSMITSFYEIFLIKKPKKNENDNCRIRTCAGRAQKISNLSP